jgi:aminoglycoside phosphotransferase (APT) family kinase protein
VEPEWQAEVIVDKALVRRLVGEQFPSLAAVSIRPFAEGWDNAVWLVNDSIVFRFPRRAIAIPGVEREIRVLPALAGELPLPIPIPSFIGRPSGAYPWPFFGGPLLPGREPASVSVNGARTAAGASLGSFLRALHDPGVLARHGTDLPEDPMGRADMARRVPKAREPQLALETAGVWSAPPSVVSILDAALDLDPPDGRALVHGDLHVRHLLVDETGMPSGVIDWGDLCVGDPSIDLSLYWSLLDPPGRAAFSDAYGVGELTPERLLRARVLALSLNGMLARYALGIGDDALLAETLSGLDRTLAD